MGRPAGRSVRDFVDSNFYWPTSIEDVCRCVKEVAAASPPGKIRVRGSQHSEEGAVYTTGFDPLEGPAPSARRVNLILDHLLGFKVSENEIAVESGHHLGPDPYAIGPAQVPANSLGHKLNRLGLALPALGGISHQSLAGFLSTGSAGGSLKYDLTDAIRWIKLVDGKGHLRVFRRTDKVFDAILPSLGLFGIIVEVGFSRKALPKWFDVRMTSTVKPIFEWEVNPFAPNQLADFFRQHEYARLLWWPQPMVNKIEVWTGKRAPYDRRLRRRPYKSFSHKVQQLAHWLYQYFFANPDLLRLRKSSHTWKEMLVAGLLNLFLEDKTEIDLCDHWDRALPHDNQISDQCIPVVFTEMWIDLNKADQVMRKLRDLFVNKRLAATGTMCFEIYVAKKRSAWLSPAHDTDVLRIDPFMYWRDKRAHRSAHNFFELHWNVLKEFDFRCHWGKALPPANGPTGASYRRVTFPKLAAFLRLRESFDPDNIFLTEYWESHLGVRLRRTLREAGRSSWREAPTTEVGISRSSSAP
jgi:D-arabinono-1,4-lactone oxidase